MLDLSSRAWLHGYISPRGPNLTKGNPNLVRFLNAMNVTSSSKGMGNLTNPNPTFCSLTQPNTTSTLVSLPWQVSHGVTVVEQTEHHHRGKHFSPSADQVICQLRIKAKTMRRVATNKTQCERGMSMASGMVTKRGESTFSYLAAARRCVSCQQRSLAGLATNYWHR